MSARPKVVILSLGGTIAMTDSGGPGVVPTLTAEMLAKAVPPLADVAEIDAVSFRQMPGAHLAFADIVSLAREIETRLDGGAVGAVVTQGTDTIEETSFLLDRLIDRDGPVVVTGAMRNPTLPGADGPANLLAAVQVATAQSARGLGCVVVMNDEIHLARRVQKTHTSNPAAFASHLGGPAGWVAEGSVRIVNRPVARRVEARPEEVAFPDVALLTAALADDGRLIDAAVAGGYRGLVIEALGGGHVPETTADRLAAAAETIPVVLATRTGSGETLRETYGFPGSETDLLGRGLIGVGALDGPKARLLLAVLLAHGASREHIAARFAEWLDG